MHMPRLLTQKKYALLHEAGTEEPNLMNSTSHITLNYPSFVVTRNAHVGDTVVHAWRLKEKRLQLWQAVIGSGESQHAIHMRRANVTQRTRSSNLEHIARRCGQDIHCSLSLIHLLFERYTLRHVAKRLFHSRLLERGIPRRP
jgi:hypothetical protein